MLLLLPITDVKLLAQWQGPYRILRKTSSVNYETETLDKVNPTRLVHVKLWKLKEEPNKKQYTSLGSHGKPFS